MIQFLLKGLLRDKSRSLLPVIVVSLGVSLTVLFTGYMKGALNGSIEQNANFDTGHLKVVTRAYAEEIAQKPMDLAMLGTTEIITDLEKQFPQMTWFQRIPFGGILDVADENGLTKVQGTASGLALDLSENSNELDRLNLRNAITEGRLPQNANEMLLGKGLIQRLKLKIGEEVTFFGSTMEGSMTSKNFNIVGVIGFGTKALDNNTFMVDLKDVQGLLDMEDGCAEIIGFLPNDVYDHTKAKAVKVAFNQSLEADTDEFAPKMLTLADQNGLEQIILISEGFGSMISFFFLIAMSIVLWNTGLLGGLRRYQEFGIRLALGESKKAVYKTMLMEAALVGFIGSVFGTILGLLATAYLQYVGINISEFSSDSGGMLMADIIRGQFTPSQLYIGFIPGVLSNVFGAMLSARGIFQRQTSELFNELGV
ncbi:ABC transporter permease [Sediminitomix flava]|uniref:Putative ABC transport system permease protein n=1 Tax=Sediminitomix flava TaxID=379075 RepID=A0A315ZIW1_SEDFL|nr:FtsX-like permease family protein [Sediminitomix flava]PWJ44634.1 putative ABC transport system permease protein [Sediminitomix flava]